MELWMMMLVLGVLIVALLVWASTGRGRRGSWEPDTDIGSFWSVADGSGNSGCGAGGDSGGGGGCGGD